MTNGGILLLGFLLFGYLSMPGRLVSSRSLSVTHARCRLKLGYFTIYVDSSNENNKIMVRQLTLAQELAVQPWNCTRFHTKVPPGVPQNVCELRGSCYQFHIVNNRGEKLYLQRRSLQTGFLTSGFVIGNYTMVRSVFVTKYSFVAHQRLLYSATNLNQSLTVDRGRRLKIDEIERSLEVEIIF